VAQLHDIYDDDDVNKVNYVQTVTCICFVILSN